MPCIPFKLIDGGHGFMCKPTISRMNIGTHRCPTCKKSRRFLMVHEEWYGWTLTCLTCGDSWQDGELRERPFKRGWRLDAVLEAKRRWKAWQYEQRKTIIEPSKHD